MSARRSVSGPWAIAQREQATRQHGSEDGEKQGGEDTGGYLSLSYTTWLGCGMLSWAVWTRAPYRELQK